MKPIKRIINQVTTTKRWYATQLGRAVAICDKETDRELQRFTPPPEWGEAWAWNFTPDGESIIMEGVER